jgi:hypothetical protein
MLHIFITYFNKLNQTFKRILPVSEMSPLWSAASLFICMNKRVSVSAFLLVLTSIISAAQSSNKINSNAQVENACFNLKLKENESLKHAGGVISRQPGVFTVVIGGAD